MRVLGGVLVLVATLLLVPFGAARAVVQDPVSCPPGMQPDPTFGTCLIVAPGQEPGPSPVRGPGHGGAPIGPAPQVCTYGEGEDAVVVPCEGEYGYYSQPRQCYIRLVDPQPPHSDPAWEGNTEGAIYRCYPPNSFHAGVIMYDFWSPAPPPGPAAPPDPRVLAQQVIETMDLSAIEIGIVPEPGPTSVGLVGMPVWMWVAEPAANTWGPITRSASSGGWTVSATARVAEVSWDMGDGTVVACGPGTAYQDRFGKTPSPTCGHTYTRQGELTVSATSHWVVDWSGIGQNGTIPMDLTRTVPVTIGEVQVLRRR